MRKQCRCLAIALTLLALPFSAGAADTVESVPDVTIDWETGSLLLEITDPLPKDSRTLPSRRYTLQQHIDRRVDRITQEILFKLPLDSYHFIGDAAYSDPALLNSLEDIHRSRRRIASVLSPDMKELTNTYQIDIYPNLISLVHVHDKASPLRPFLGFEPTAPFTGIVIDARGALPQHGKNDTAELQPCLLPEIFDAKMENVLRPDQVLPSFMGRWGMVQYSRDADESRFEDRIGRFPYRITARKLFGKLPTDLIISEEASRKILTSDHNRQLLKEGRILVIY